SVKEFIRNNHYITSRSKWLKEPLAKAILGLPVNKYDEITVANQSITYQELSSFGILNLVQQTTGDYLIRLPYVWASVIVERCKDRGMDYWKSMLNYDEPMYWQNFEDFNVKFWALRLSLFELLGHKTIQLKKLLKGAKFSRD